MMSDIAGDAFHRVQRFSTDWHANSFAGSTVRKVTRGMWALDLLNDTILVALFPSLVMLVGSTLLLGWYWPMMGVIVAVGSIIYIGADRVAVARLCRAGGEPRQHLGHAAGRRAGRCGLAATRWSRVLAPRSARKRASRRSSPSGGIARSRTWVRGTINGTTQGVTLLVLRAAVIGFALLLWSRGQASAGDITFVLTSFFVLQGYLRDVGMHVRNLQRSVNDMEELVDIQASAARHRRPAGRQADPHRRRPHRLRQRDVPLRPATGCRSIATSR